MNWKQNARFMHNASSLKLKRFNSTDNRLLSQAMKHKSNLVRWRGEFRDCIAPSCCSLLDGEYLPW